MAATKTYTGQMLMFYLIAYALGGDIRIEDLKRLPDWAESALKLEKSITSLCERYRFMEQAVVVGRGLNYSNAFEFALKLMETCYVVTERFSSADFLHGPIAMVEPSFPVFLFAPTGVTSPSMRSMLAKLRKLKAETVVITDAANRGIEEARDTLYASEPEARRIVYADSLYHPGADFRGLSGQPEGTRSRPSTHVDEDHAHAVS